MNADQLDEPCIEVEFPLGDRKAFTVAEYEADLHLATRLSDYSHSFHELMWTHHAPRVEHLSTEWQKPSRERFRISDPEAYDVQMKQLLGLV